MITTIPISSHFHFDFNLFFSHILNLFSQFQLSDDTPYSKPPPKQTPPPSKQQKQQQPKQSPQPQKQLASPSRNNNINNNNNNNKATTTPSKGSVNIGSGAVSGSGSTSNLKVNSGNNVNVIVDQPLVKTASASSLEKKAVQQTTESKRKELLDMINRDLELKKDNLNLVVIGHVDAGSKQTNHIVVIIIIIKTEDNFNDYYGINIEIMFNVKGRVH